MRVSDVARTVRDWMTLTLLALPKVGRPLSLKVRPSSDSRMSAIVAASSQRVEAKLVYLAQSVSAVAGRTSRAVTAMEAKKRSMMSPQFGGTLSG